MKLWEKFVFIGGGCVILLLPLLCAFLGGLYGLLAVFAGIIIIWLINMGRIYCRHCMNFACPFNRVPNGVRECFFSHNPTVADAWKKEKNIHNETKKKD
jgi:Na+-transporting NADH:ubiquinone oxidoreductase subunit NqrD